MNKSSLNLFWMWLCAFLVLNAVDPEQEEEIEIEEEQEEELEEELEQEEEEEESESEPRQSTKPSRANTAIIEARRRAQEAEDRAKRAEEALNNASRGAPQPSQEQQLFQQEEAKLKDPNTTDLEKWQINSNRTLRQMQNDSRMALIQSQDLSDKTIFESRAAKDPVIAKYSDKVEKELIKLRSSGQNAPREAIAAMLIGRDVMAGNFKSKAVAKKPDVNRGKPVNARSDVNGKGRLTEQQKRAKRLEDIQL